jgi:hypothetical protein
MLRRHGRRRTVDEAIQCAVLPLAFPVDRKSASTEEAREILARLDAARVNNGSSSSLKVHCTMVHWTAPYTLNSGPAP